MFSFLSKIAVKGESIFQNLKGGFYKAALDVVSHEASDLFESKASSEPNLRSIVSEAKSDLKVELNKKIDNITFGLLSKKAINKFTDSVVDQIIQDEIFFNGMVKSEYYLLNEYANNRSVKITEEFAEELDFVNIIGVNFE